MVQGLKFLSHLTAGVIGLGTLAACSNGQQLYSTTQLLPVEKKTGVSAADGDVQSVSKSAAAEQGAIVIASNGSQAVGEAADVLAENGFSRQFWSSRRESHEITFTASSSRVTSNLTMGRVESARSVTFNQPTREPVVDLFAQGGSGQRIVEESTQSGAKGALDILIVVDDSGSMKSEQKNLSTKLEPLLSEIGESDWKIGVITTSKSKPNLRGIISRGDANAQDAFRAAVTPGINGDGKERGIYQAIQGLKTNGFLRTGSSVAVLIVSDEDNCSKGTTDCPDEEGSKASDLLNYLSQSAQRELKTQARVYGLVWIPGTTCQSGYARGHVYAEAIEASGGRAGSICAADYTATLKDISSNVRSILQNSWTLKHTPDAGSLRVFLDDVEVQSGYQLVGKSVTFTQVPAASVKIRFEYDVGSKPILTSFRLSQVPHNGALTILVNGKDIGTAYSLSANDPQVLVLNNSAPSFASIKARYKKAAVLPSSYRLEGSVKANSVVVSVNGDKVAHFYDAKSQTVSLSSAPVEGAAIKIDYTELGAAILEYPFNALQSGLMNLSALDVSSQESVPVSFDSQRGVLTFAPSDFVTGRRLRVSYDDALILSGVYPLPQVPLPETIRVLDAMGFPVCTTQGSLQVNGNLLILNCGFEAGEEFSVSYDSAAAVMNTFVIKELTPEQCDALQWQVRAGDTPWTPQFVRDGCSFRALAQLPSETQVVISADSLVD